MVKSKINLNRDVRYFYALLLYNLETTPATVSRSKMMRGAAMISKRVLSDIIYCLSVYMLADCCCVTLH